MRRREGYNPAMRRTLLALLAATALTATAAPLAAQSNGKSKLPPSEPVAWITDYEAGMKLAKQTGRPVLIDFWCGT